MSGRILVAYATGKGATRGVAEVLGEQLSAGGATVDVRPVGEVADLSGYRAVVVGSAIHGGRWLPEALAFVQSNQARLSQVPTAAFLVSMMLAKDPVKWDATAKSWLEPVRTLVKPVAEGFFPGAVLLKDYSLFEGLGMRIFLACIWMSAGDYRDWNAVRAWADEIRPRLLG